MTIAIIWPAIALVGLIYLVWIILFVQRLGHIRRTPPTAESFATGAAARRYFQPVEMPANNLANLFEMPVLFFALVPLLAITGQAGHVQLALAWIYVAVRAVHSWFHLRGGVLNRFRAYFLSTIVLAAMWVGFLVDMIALAGA